MLTLKTNKQTEQPSFTMIREMPVACQNYLQLLIYPVLLKITIMGEVTFRVPCCPSWEPGIRLLGSLLWPPNPQGTKPPMVPPAGGGPTSGWAHVAPSGFAQAWSLVCFSSSHIPSLTPEWGPDNSILNSPVPTRNKLLLGSLVHKPSTMVMWWFMEGAGLSGSGIWSGCLLGVS